MIFGVVLQKSFRGIEVLPHYKIIIIPNKNVQVHTAISDIPKARHSLEPRNFWILGEII